MPFLFEKLKVYQRSVDFAEAIMTATAEFPRGHRSLADQLNRASTSIAANIAEGNGRFTKADRKNFFIIARGSVHECVPFLELAYRKNLISEEQFVMLKENLEEISRMLTGLIKGAERGRCEGYQAVNVRIVGLAVTGSISDPFS